MNTRALERQARRLQQRIQPAAPIGLPPTYWIDENGAVHVALEGDERSMLPPAVYGFDPNEDGIDDDDQAQEMEEEDQE